MLKHDNFYLKTVHKTHFRHRNHRECRDFDTREQFTSHKVGSNTRRVTVFDICQNLKRSLIRISEFPEASVMIEQLRVGITPRPHVVLGNHQNLLKVDRPELNKPELKEALELNKAASQPVFFLKTEANNKIVTHSAPGGRERTM